MLRFTVIAVLVLLIQSCTTTNQVATVDSLAFTGKTSAIALMPLDVELSLLTAAGSMEPRSEWSDAAKGFMQSELEEYLKTKEVGLHDGSDIQSDELLDLLSLHEVVGGTIMFHHYFLPLPTKQKKLAWTLGDEASALRDNLDADYGLFVFVRDSYSSGGRIALQVLAAVAGAGVQGGVQLGFASLVDLRTGDIVWFNRLVSTTGDLREEEPAAKTVKKLMEGFPL